MELTRDLHRRLEMLGACRGAPDIGTSLWDISQSDARWAEGRELLTPAEVRQLNNVAAKSMDGYVKWRGVIQPSLLVGSGSGDGDGDGYGYGYGSADGYGDGSGSGYQ